MAKPSCSQYGGTWSSSNSNTLAYYGDKETADFLGAAAAGGDAFSFGANGSVSLHGNEVTSINVRPDGYYVNWVGSSSQAQSGNLSGVTMGVTHIGLNSSSGVNYSGGSMGSNDQGGGGSNGGGGENWTAKANAAIGSFGFGWGAKENLLEYAAKIAPEIENLKYFKAVKVVSKGLLAAQVVVSGA